MAARVKLDPRDYEILRALLRVRFLTTRQFSRAFFSCPRVARRRVQRLSEYDLIRPHTKGMPEVLRYTAWRLTQRGLDTALHAFSDEPVPDGLIDRLATASLHHALHREGLADLYLGLVVPDRAGLAEGTLSAHRRWVAEMRARADAITWQPDGDVVLCATRLGQRVDVVPDAVVRSPRQRRQIFIELDRSTKDLGRIREGLDRYETVLQHSDMDGEAVAILFVVRSAARRESIQACASGGLPMIALKEVEALEWLREQLVLRAGATPPHADSPVETAARRAYTWMVQLQAVLVDNGMHATLKQAEPAFMQEGYEKLSALYRSLKAFQQRGARP
jgi:Replication-relaxation